MEGADIGCRDDNEVTHYGIWVRGVDGHHAAKAERREVLLSNETEAVVDAVPVESDEDRLVKLLLLTDEGLHQVAHRGVYELDERGLSQSAIDNGGEWGGEHGAAEIAREGDDGERQHKAEARHLTDNGYDREERIGPRDYRHEDIDCDSYWHHIEKTLKEVREDILHSVVIHRIKKFRSVSSLRKMKSRTEKPHKDEPP